MGNEEPCETLVINPFNAEFELSCCWLGEACLRSKAPFDWKVAERVREVFSKFFCRAESLFSTPEYCFWILMLRSIPPGFAF